MHCLSFGPLFHPGQTKNPPQNGGRTPHTIRHSRLVLVLLFLKSLPVADFFFLPALPESRVFCFCLLLCSKCRDASRLWRKVVEREDSIGICVSELCHVALNALFKKINIRPRQCEEVWILFVSKGIFKVDGKLAIF